MQDKFTRQAANALKLAKTTAQSCNHSYIGTEHILVGLLKEKEGTAGRILEEFNVEEDALRQLIEELIAPSEVLVTEKALLVAVPFWEIPLEKGAWAYWIHPSYLPVSYKKIIGFSDDWKILYIGTQQEGGVAQISIEGMYIPVSDKKKIIAYIERKQKNSG